MMGILGFCDKWRQWIRGCIFLGKCSVLINGSPTEEINIQRGLKQGDPLAPFLFLLVAEGLTGLMNGAVSLEKFSGCRIGNEGPQISLLQYADDTIVVGEASWDNIWVMKSVFRCFELVSGMKVNFNKTRLIGINVDDDFISSGADFLNCKIGGDFLLSISVSPLEQTRGAYLLGNQSLVPWRGTWQSRKEGIYLLEGASL